MRRSVALLLCSACRALILLRPRRLSSLGELRASAIVLTSRLVAALCGSFARPPRCSPSPQWVRQVCRSTAHRHSTRARCAQAGQLPGLLHLPSRALAHALACADLASAARSVNLLANFCSRSADLPVRGQRTRRPPTDARRTSATTTSRCAARAGRAPLHRSSTFRALGADPGDLATESLMAASRAPSTRSRASPAKIMPLYTRLHCP